MTVASKCYVFITPFHLNLHHACKHLKRFFFRLQRAISRRDEINSKSRFFSWKCEHKLERFRKTCFFFFILSYTNHLSNISLLHFMRSAARRKVNRSIEPDRCRVDTNRISIISVANVNEAGMKSHMYAGGIAYTHSAQCCRGIYTEYFHPLRRERDPGAYKGCIRVRRDFRQALQRAVCF